MDEAKKNEGVIELDVLEDAEIIALIDAYKVLKDEETSIDLRLEEAKEKLNEAFKKKGVMGKGKFLVMGKTVLSRSMSSKTTFDRDILMKLAPSAARKAMKVSNFSVFRRPAG